MKPTENPCFGRFISLFLLIAISLAVLFISGCAQRFFINYRLSEVMPAMVVSPSNLSEWFFEEDTVSVQDVQVVYNSGLKEQAIFIANHVNDIISFLKNELGVKLPPVKIRIYLIRTEIMPSYLKLRIERNFDTFHFPLFVVDGQEGCDTIILNNTYHLFSLTHELVEMSLTWPRGDFPTLKIDNTFFGFLTTSNNTRWFRDGFANYASYLAYKKMPSYATYLED